MEVDSKFSPRAQEDLELVRRAVEETDQKAYAKLMSKYRDSIYFMVLKMVHNRDDAEDLTIEAFGKAFKNIEKYSPDFAFSTWLYKIATNNAIDYIRKKRLQTLSIDETRGDEDDGSTFAASIQSKGLDPEEEYIRAQRLKLMREVTEKLNDKYRILIELRYFSEYSYEEIAEELQLPLGTVKAQLFRAKELLFNILKNTRERI
jgi:RNA polymerase sigma factor (sigma-70 family)